MPDKGLLTDINCVLRDEVDAGVVDRAKQKTGHGVPAAGNGRQTGLGWVERESARPVSAVVDILPQSPELSADFDSVPPSHPGHDVIGHIGRTSGHIFVI